MLFLLHRCKSTDGVKAPTGEERRGCAEVGVVKLHVVGPLLPSSQSPRCPPFPVVLHSSCVVILSDLHTQHAAFSSHWEKQMFNSDSFTDIVLYCPRDTHHTYFRCYTLCKVLAEQNSWTPPCVMCNQGVVQYGGT